ncbi:hypothetical protein V1291_004690 [Nitrobacteraceae bacterium AZCC 1564]
MSSHTQHTLSRRGFCLCRMTAGTLAAFAPWLARGEAESTCLVSPPLAKFSRGTSGDPAESASKVGRVRVAR